MADDFELTITIRAIDEASSLLNELSDQMSEDFGILSAEAAGAAESINQGLNTVAPALAELVAAAEAVEQAFRQVGAAASELSEAVSEDFAAMSAEAAELAQSMAEEVNSIEHILAQLVEGSESAGSAFDQTTVAALGLDEALSTLQQDATLTLQALDQFTAAMAAASETAAIAVPGGFDFLSSGGGLEGAIQTTAPGAFADLFGAPFAGGGQPSPLGNSLDAFGPSLISPVGNLGGSSADLVSVSRQQLDVLGQLLDALQAGQAGQQLIQYNTFNGVLDPGAIRDQIIPELERAMSLGFTLLSGI